MLMGFSVFVVLLVGGVLLAVALGGSQRQGQTGGFRPSDEQRRPTPRQLLDQRLARGEISSKEYEAIRSRIEQ